MNRIIIEAVAPEDMRPPYNTQDAGGDWLTDESGNLVIRVIGRDLDTPETFLFALHELVEAMLCRKEGVIQEAVDAFDLGFTGEGEPGDDPLSPYRTQHRKAMLIEHLMAQFLGLDDYGTIS